MKRALLFAAISFLLSSCSGRAKINQEYINDSIRIADSIALAEFKEQHPEEFKETPTINKVKMSNEEFCKSITEPEMGIHKASVTDANMLIIGVRPIGKPNFDVLAQSYLESAIEHGVNVRACFVVDVDKAKWQKGAVIGDRIGKAYR
jgi:hypothetical protein|uniref:Prokaryotic membrane lipoprotein lipid attachment site n=1 Tax=Myoviridae sp. ctcPl3 TaxID=2826669 RepID=A0A8S5QVR4_9CAUD|nr:MAG TPA: Prokaryotic membrane lipoprotein lipid attachment site [Myoviridae sp. ctcPl3]